MFSFIKYQNMTELSQFYEPLLETNAYVSKIILHATRSFNICFGCIRWQECELIRDVHPWGRWQSVANSHCAAALPWRWTLPSVGCWTDEHKCCTHATCLANDNEFQLSWEFVGWLSILTTTELCAIGTGVVHWLELIVKKVCSGVFLFKHNVSQNVFFIIW